MRKNYLFYSFFALLLGFVACIPPSSQDRATNINDIDLTNPVIQRLFNFQDQLLTDSLVNYFKSSDPTLRFLAAQAMASVKDKKALVGLEALLNDDVDKIRIAAAYAIGQIGDSTSASALIKSFKMTDTVGLYKHFNAAILEAVGKCAPASYLKPLASVASYKSTDTVLLEGQCHAIYRYLTRGITATEGTQKMISYAGNSRYPNSVRMIASNYLARAKDISIDSTAASTLTAAMTTDNDYRIRMTLAKTLGKATNITTMYGLVNQLGRESDYRVKVSCINALGSYNYELVQPVIGNYLRDNNLHIANAAANFYINKGVEKDAATIYWALAKDSSLHPITQLMMYQATNRHVSSFMVNTKGWVNAELYKKFNHVKNPNEQVALLRALAEYPWNYKFIKESAFSIPSPLVRTTAVELLGQIAANPSFYKIFAGNSKGVRVSLFQYFLEALDIGDPGMVAMAAAGLKTPTMEYKYIYAKMLDKSFLTNAQNKLKLPRDIETWNELQKTIDAFNGTVSEPRKAAFNQPIDWKLLNAYPQKPKATVATKYGNFVIELDSGKAPGSVVNFIQLANNNFYNGKNFHRVVSNFVIQGGCTRGDGYGALDYSIRSELPYLHWDTEGLVGMASSGNHTEGTQFFVSNAPALHLDGNYTIFGKVIEGMEVVHKIQASDVITKVTVK
jgi:cyclophilin family peptidyl-prolyl cis-trans isomerase/HEAT repeat protein